MIELSKCPTCAGGDIRKNCLHGNKNKLWRFCVNCGFVGPMDSDCDTAWNTLCAEIEVGRAVLEFLLKKQEFVQVSDHLYEMKDGDVIMNVPVIVRPIPKALSKDEALDILWKDLKTEIANTPAFQRTPFQSALLARITAALAEKEGAE